MPEDLLNPHEEQKEQDPGTECSRGSDVTIIQFSAADFEVTVSQFSAADFDLLFLPEKKNPILVPK